MVGAIRNHPNAKGVENTALVGPGAAPIPSRDKKLAFHPAGGFFENADCPNF